MNLLKNRLLKPNFWKNKKNFMSFLLFPFSIIYFLVFSLKKKISNSYQYKIPIICVGNIFLGGTGKTPLSLYISRKLKSKYRPAIIKKYYFSQTDEINLIKNVSNNLFVSKNRDLAISECIKKKYNVAILDDGFQDFSIKKDCSIICFHEQQLWGNEMVLPAGPLREPLEGIKKANIVILNGKKNLNFEKKIRSISNEIKIFYSLYKLETKNISMKKNYLAFAGIGNPENFFSLLEAKGVRLKKTISFPDHYIFSKQELTGLCKLAKDNKLEVLTTEKDFIRIKRLGFKKIKPAKINLEIRESAKFVNEIKKLIQ